MNKYYSVLMIIISLHMTSMLFASTVDLSATKWNCTITDSSKPGSKEKNNPATQQIIAKATSSTSKDDKIANMSLANALDAAVKSCQAQDCGQISCVKQK